MTDFNITVNARQAEVLEWYTRTLLEDEEMLDMILETSEASEEDFKDLFAQVHKAVLNLALAEHVANS